MERLYWFNHSGLTFVIRFFFHETDIHTLTSKNGAWNLKKMGRKRNRSQDNKKVTWSGPQEK